MFTRFNRCAIALSLSLLASCGSAPEAAEVALVPPDLNGSIAGYDPMSPPKHFTKAEVYRADVAFWSGGAVASSNILAMSTEATEIAREATCEVLAGDMPLSMMETIMSDSFRKNGIDEMAAGKMADGFIKVTTQPGKCD